MKAFFLANMLSWFLVSFGSEVEVGLVDGSSDVSEAIAFFVEEEARCFIRKHIAVMKYKENSNAFGLTINGSACCIDGKEKGR